MKRFFLWISAIAIIVILSIYAIKFYNRVALIDADYSKAISSLKTQLAKLDTKKSNYYYINIWNLRCKPCIQEMPVLDSIAGKVSGNIKFIFVSDDENEAVKKFMERKGIKMKNFIFLNDMNYLISALYKKANNSYKVYPTHVILDSLDNVIFFSQGSLKKKLDFEDMKLKKGDKEKFMETLQDPVIKKLESLN